MQTVLDNTVQTIPVVPQAETNGNGLPRPYRWSVSEYYRAAEAGLFEGKRVQLIKGEIVEMAPMGLPHSIAIRLIRRVLESVFQADYLVDSQLPLSFDNVSVPEPDISVVEGSLNDLHGDHPRYAVLVVEVADTSLRYDRGKKAALYAEFGIDDYWIVNLRDRCVEVHRSPVNDVDLGWVYSETRSYSESESLSPLAKSAASIVVSDLLP